MQATSIVSSNTTSVNPTHTNHLPRQAQLIGKAMSDQLFVNACRQDSGTFTKRFLFLSNERFFEDSISVLEAEIRNQYYQYNRPHPDVTIHRSSLDLDRSKEEIRENLRGLIDTNKSTSNVFIFELTSSTHRDVLDKLNYALKQPNTNRDRIILVTKDRKLFESFPRDNNPKKEVMPCEIILKRRIYFPFIWKTQTVQ